MKNFEEFVEEVKGNIMDYLPEEYAEAEITVQETRKLNESYQAITVRKEGQVVTPSINLDTFYKDYDGSTKSLNDALEKIGELVQRQPDNLKMEVFTEYDVAKENLFIRVSSLEANKDLVEKAPHIIKEDLLITYHILAEVQEDGMATIMVNNYMMESFGITQEQLHEDALVSSEKLFPATIQSMSDVVRPMILSEMIASGIDPEVAESQIDEMTKGEGTDLTVVSNEQKLNGAGVLFYPDVMEQLAERFGGDFFILPSSLHETLAIPDDGNTSYQELKEMVEEVNATQVEPEDKLTDEVYHFDSKDHVFEKASSFADRLKAKEKAAESVAEKKEYNQKEKELMKPKRRSTEMSI